MVGYFSTNLGQICLFMNIYSLQQLKNNPQLLTKNVLSVGNFDGVHLGHQAMLAQLNNLAQRFDLASCVMIFEPQPREFFNPNTAPPRLSNLDEKLALLQQFDVQNVIVASFDEDFRHLSAQSFAELLKRLSVQQLVLGDDFRFGHDRIGDSDFLQKSGFMVHNLGTVVDNQQIRISSTKVREYLLNGDLLSAKQILGRDYTITGKVVHGDKIGRTLDFPTANIALNRIRPPLHGVFAVDVLMQGDNFAEEWDGLAGFSPNSLFGCANIGTRPSVNGEDWRLEVYLPNFQGDLYNKILTVKFLHFLHGEKKYNDINALKNGIQQDVSQLLNWRTMQLRKDV